MKRNYIFPYKIFNVPTIVHAEDVYDAVEIFLNRWPGKVVWCKPGKIVAVEVGETGEVIYLDHDKRIVNEHGEVLSDYVR